MNVIVIPVIVTFKCSVDETGVNVIVEEFPPSICIPLLFELSILVKLTVMSPTVSVSFVFEKFLFVNVAVAVAVFFTRGCCVIVKCLVTLCPLLKVPSRSAS